MFELPSAPFVRFHSSADYAVLPDIDEGSVGILTESDRRCLDAIGMHLVRSRQTDTFGIALLHRHFDIHDNEVLVQAPHRESEAFVMRPLARTEPLAKTLRPTTVRFAPQRTGCEPDVLDLIGLEYVETTAARETARFEEADAPILRDLQRILNEHEKIERFGVRAVSALALARDRVYVETCDPVNRILTLEKHARSAQEGGRDIETFWVWEAATVDELEPKFICTANCHVTCSQRGPIGHGTDHREDHQRR